MDDVCLMLCSTEDLNRFLNDEEGPVLIDRYVSQMDVVRIFVTTTKDYIWVLQTDPSSLQPLCLFLCFAVCRLRKFRPTRRDSFRRTRTKLVSILVVLEIAAQLWGH